MTHGEMKEGNKGEEEEGSSRNMYRRPKGKAKGQLELGVGGGGGSGESGCWEIETTVLE